MTKTYDTLTYVICHNGSDVVHPSKVTPETTLSSGQPHVEEFETEELWKSRLKELNFDISTLEPPQAPSLNPEIPEAPATRREIRERKRSQLA